ncbi:hypothetical protein L1987_53816 [Smallanthus sonchifolius]|uniref:Uncharacterized protein n=1 Tax=Smallanthus sonchifolius TaxID=185202 RepID=A0ACB9EWE0_9ASTR|nr:hypothetical protein L1987_53816 [Smallanthus sonchifolius]
MVMAWEVLTNSRMAQCEEAIANSINGEGPNVAAMVYAQDDQSGRGDPFITLLELRLLDITMYKDQSGSLIFFERPIFGTTETVSGWMLQGKISKGEGGAAGAKGNSHQGIKITKSYRILRLMKWKLRFVWVLELQDYPQLRKGKQFTCIRDNGKKRSKIDRVLIQGTKMTTPAKPNQTDDQDAAAIWSTKSTYGFTELKWQGDPCVPQAWIGLNCHYNDLGAARIISLNLSSRGLSGDIATALANLTMIESLDLSYNNLTGNVPKFLAQLDYLRNLNLTGNNFTRPLPAELLAKSKKGSLSLSIEDIGSCLKASNTSNKHTIVILAITIITLFIVGLFASVIIVWEVKRRKAKAFIKREASFTPRKQQFTYSEVVSITSNFQNEIGRGGFGRVFHGLVEENQVAVKMLSESKVTRNFKLRSSFSWKFIILT